MLGRSERILYHHYIREEKEMAKTAVRAAIPDTLDVLVSTLAELREQTLWLRFLGMEALGPKLETALVTSKQRAVFELSDGERSVREIADLAAVGVGTVSRLWSEWAQLGIVVESGKVPGRWRHLARMTVGHQEE
jgi:DNA-directed RNA polymerase specialized sigma24 family protein